MRRDTHIIVGLLVVVVAAGVSIVLYDRADLNSNNPQNNQAAAIVPFTTLAKGAQSKINSRVNYLITTQEELVELWEFLEEPPPVPTVDFTTKVVAAVFAGKVPTAGYAIAVSEIEDADNRVVKVELIKPDESCVLAQSVTTPYQVIELPKTSLPFTHADIWVTKDCS